MRSPADGTITAILVGTCMKMGNKMIFITQEGTYIGRYNFVLRIEVIAFLVLRYRESVQLIKMCFLSPEINCIHSIGNRFVLSMMKILLKRE